MSAPAIPSTRSPADDTRLAWLLGLHGLALLVAYPLGPQQARLWQPGVPGIAALVAAFPVAAAAAALFAKHARQLPSSPRTLAWLGFAGTLPSVLSAGYASFFAGRVIGGLVAGVSVVALQRVLLARPAPQLVRVSARVTAFGMPVCVLAATLSDWHAVTAPVGVAFLYLALTTTCPRDEHDAPRTTRHKEPAPAALIATSALAFVTSAYLTVLSGFLVLNAGHTEYHIPGGLLTAALLSLLVPALMRNLNHRMRPSSVFMTTLAAAVASLSALLLLRTPVPALVAFLLIGGFVAIHSMRHLALNALVARRVLAHALPVHQTHSYIAHCFGSGLGALCAGQVVFLQTTGTLGGMETLFGCSVAATALALATGLYTSQANAAPAARAASAKSRWRVAASLARSVRTSITRKPGTPT